MHARPSLLSKAIAYVTSHGLKQFGVELSYRCVNCYYERRFGIDTAGHVKLADLGVHQSDARDSMPIGYRAFFSTLRRIPLRRSDVSFLDFGAGKGRAVCAAATFPLKHVTGIELSDSLAHIARANVEGMRHRRARCIDVRCGDATELCLCGDENVIYFFNPFAGDTLAKVLENIRRSHEESPRKIYVIFFNNDHFDKVVLNHSWIRKTYQTTYYPRISCGVYETVALGSQP